MKKNKKKNKNVLLATILLGIIIAGAIMFYKMGIITSGNATARTPVIGDRCVVDLTTCPTEYKTLAKATIFEGTLNTYTKNNKQYSYCKKGDYDFSWPLTSPSKELSCAKITLTKSINGHGTFEITLPAGTTPKDIEKISYSGCSPRSGRSGGFSGIAITETIWTDKNAGKYTNYQTSYNSPNVGGKNCAFSGIYTPSATTTDYNMKSVLINFHPRTGGIQQKGLGLNILITLNQPLVQITPITQLITLNNPVFIGPIRYVDKSKPEDYNVRFDINGITEIKGAEFKATTNLATPLTSITKDVTCITQTNPTIHLECTLKNLRYKEQIPIKIVATFNAEGQEAQRELMLTRLN